VNLEQFIKFTTMVSAIKNQHLRWGQSIMIVLLRTYPSIYDAINLTELDCFYDDNRAEALFLHLLGATCDSK
jgi:hypothetical protein